MEKDISTDALAGFPAVILSGREKLLIDSYMHKISNAFISPAAKLLDYVVVEGEGAQASDVIGALETMPMLSQKRVVVLKDLPGDDRTLSTAEMKDIAACIPSISETSLLIVTADSVSKKSDLYKSVEKSGRVYVFEKLGAQDVKAFIKGRLKDDGKSASSEVVEAILQASGYLNRESETDLFSLEGDVKRIAAYSAESDVKLADVSACMGASLDADVFRLLDAVSNGQKGTAFELVHHLSERGETTFRLLNTLIGQFELMLGYREMQEQGHAFSEIMSRLGVKSEYRLKKAAGFAKNYSVAKLMELLERLYRVEPDIKTGLFGENLALTMFIAEM
jgi:DNA polymerase-3 subunit delta